jgi:hypothetical protein
VRNLKALTSKACGMARRLAFQQFSSSLAALLFSFPSLPRRAAAAERVKHSDSRLRDPEKKE